MSKTKAKQAAASRKPSSTSRYSLPSPTLAGSPVGVELYQVLQLTREDGSIVNLVLTGYGNRTLVKGAALTDATRKVDPGFDLANIGQIIPLQQMCRASQVGRAVIVNHLHHGCVGSFQPSHHEWADKWFGNELIYQKVEHKNRKILRHDWQHFVEKIGSRWGYDVRQLKPEYVEDVP